MTAGSFDEMSASAGVVRPSWQKYSAGIDALGAVELARRWDGAHRIIRDHGVSYNIYGDPRGQDRFWELDPIPLLIAADEWRTIEAALIQRARLLSLVLSDLYGPQRLLHSGRLPGAMIFGNPMFLRPCHGVPVPDNVRLHLYAVDLGRSPDGQWWVMADHTQAPSGAGYALENRIVLSRSFPELYRDCQVQRLEPFFAKLRATFANLAPRTQANPRIVLLTPGPNHETYFEHSFLARYLGYPLVEGGDLTVRDCRVYLKTLEGLQPVDVILRRLDDELCDPLELRSDSFLGIAGLVETAQAGNVVVANALGSGLVEGPVFTPFLPQLARELLGESLRLPSVATWWCGQPDQLRYVEEHIDELVMKPAFQARRAETEFGHKLSAAQKAECIAKLREQPEQFVGQELVRLATAPVWTGDRLEVRPTTLRVYLAADGDSFVVMPGGLTRVALSGDTVDVAVEHGGGSKDTWVTAAEHEPALGLLQPARETIELQSAANDLPSRVADNLFWLGRYAERAEDRVRLVRTVLSRLMYETLPADSGEFAALMQILDSLQVIHSDFKSDSRGPVRALEQELFSFIYKQQRSGSLRETLNRLHRMAWLVRSRLSTDTWRILNELHQDVARSRPTRTDTGEALVLLNRVVTTLAAFSGMEMENMTRGHGWRFLDVGRRIERGTNLISVTRTMVAEYPNDPTGVLEALLDVADSSMTYRSRYFDKLQLSAVLDLLLKDRSNPRSILFQLASLSRHVDLLPRDPASPNPSREQVVIRESIARLEHADLLQICGDDQSGLTPNLEDLLLRLAADLRQLSDVLMHYYFSHAKRSQQIGDAR
ncbi:MAG: circularly permuted type 2 ATP-grasp protein [Verrucomicrobiota bacterium]